MFVWQNANHDICVTFTDNKPVQEPEYVFVIDEATKTISVNGTVVSSDTVTEDEPVEEDTVEPEVTVDPEDEVEPEVSEEE